MNTKVYIADVSPLMDPAIFEKLLMRVPAYRREKAMRFKFQKNRAQSLGVGLLLRQACEDFGVAGADEFVVYGENEKPRFANCFGIHFNLSHSDMRAMCIVSPHEVGCDVERIEKNRGDLAERFFMPEESAWIGSFTTEQERTAAFYRLWTLKECYMKVTGLGLSLSPDKFTLRLNENGVLLLHGGEHPEYVFDEYDLHDGYKYAFCMLSDGKISEVEKIIYNMSTLI